MKPLSIQHSTISNPLGSLEELRDLLAFPELHIRLLPVGPLADEPSLTLHLAVRDRRANRLDLGTEQLLDRPLDIHLRRPRRDLEYERAVAFTNQGRLLG